MKNRDRKKEGNLLFVFLKFKIIKNISISLTSYLLIKRKMDIF